MIVVVLFGASRLRGLGGALGGSIREFKTAVRDESNPDGKPEKAEKVDS